MEDFGLFFQGFQNLWMAMTEIIGRVPAQIVKVAFALNIPHKNTWNWDKNFVFNMRLFALDIVWSGLSDRQIFGLIWGKTSSILNAWVSASDCAQVFQK